MALNKEAIAALKIIVNANAKGENHFAGNCTVEANYMVLEGHGFINCRVEMCFENTILMLVCQTTPVGYAYLDNLGFWPKAKKAISASPKAAWLILAGAIGTVLGVALVKYFGL